MSAANITGVVGSDCGFRLGGRDMPSSNAPYPEVLHMASSRSSSKASSLQVSPSSPESEQIQSLSSSASRKRHTSQPPDTFDYTVGANQSLASIAAHFDVTPSLLKRLNRLNMDFVYPGQVIYIPMWASLDQKPCSQSPITVPTGPTPTVTSDFLTASSKEKDLTSSFERSNNVYELSQMTESEKLAARMFVKLSSQYLTQDKGNVDGTLLVTPNAVMYDPNVSNPTVIETGAEAFTFVAKMDMIVSLAIYRSIEDMYCMHRHRTDTSIAKPAMYHSAHCDLVTQGDEVDQITSSPIVPRNLSCSCGVDSTLDGVMADKRQPSIYSAESGESTRLRDSREESRVRFDLDTEATSDPISFAPTRTKPINIGFSLEKDKREYSCSPLRTHRRNPSNNSSLYSGGLHLSSSCDVYVDYTSGLFKKPSMCSIDSQNLFKSCPEEPIQECAGSMPSAVRILSGFQLHSAVSKEDKPELFKPIEEILPSHSVPDYKNQCSNQDQPFYLCLRVRQSQQVSDHWFTVDKNKVDQLYEFFVQWRPELYNDEDVDEVIGAAQGFVHIDDKTAPCINDCMMNLPNSPTADKSASARVFKDWEIVSLEEIMRRKSLLDIEKYLPLPELVGHSEILTEAYLRQLVSAVPARVEGNPWQLLYGSDDNGFSLSTLYRQLAGIDSPVLLVIQDTEDRVFGAYGSRAFHVCEHFYGTGESFLFTMVDGFRVYPWVRKNNLFIKGSLKSLAIGAGTGSYGLWLDGDIYHGRTQHCETFDNQPLTGDDDDEDFIVKVIEVWGFMLE